MIYLFVFGISILFFILASKFKTKNKTIFYIFSGIAILIPCILAGLRDSSIGTDVEVYIEGWFDYAKYCSTFGQFMNSLSSNDILYLLLTYTISKTTDNISYLLFSIQLLNIVPIVIALNKYDDKVNVPFGMFIYFLYWYNMSFNIARQSIALSFFILAIVYLLKQKKLTFFILLIIAILFHNSAIIGFIVYFVYSKSGTKYSLMYTCLYLAVIVLFLMNFETIVRLLINIGLLPSRYMTYITKYLRSEINFNLINNIFYFGLLFISGIAINRNNKNNQFLFTSFILGIGIFESGMISSFADRASYYFLYPGMFFMIPQIISKNEKLTRNKLLYVILIIVILFIYWLFWIVYVKQHETYPFIFRN